MSRPQLTVIAGCNGSGKSSFSSAISPSGAPSFDYDKEFLKIYRAMPDSELRENMAHNKTFEILRARVNFCIKNQKSFTYETNFNSTPLFWPEKFKKAGFGLNLIYLCLDTTAEAKRRVRVRVANGGHFVPDFEVEKRFYDGYDNLNLHWSYFDELFLFDSSPFRQQPHHFLSCINHEVVYKQNIPPFVYTLLPSLL